MQNGLVRLGHNVLAISDRDIISKNKTFKDFSGKKSLQNAIINTCENFKADCVILGHADAVENNTLDVIKNSKILMRRFVVWLCQEWPWTSQGYARRPFKHFWITLKSIFLLLAKSGDNI